MARSSEWIQSKGGWPGVAGWLLVATRSSVSFGLALFAGVAALSAARFIQEVPDVRLETEITRLIDATALSEYPQAVHDVVEAFNADVRESQGEVRNDLTLKQVLPSAADPNVSINPDTVGSFVAYSQDLGSWATYTGTEILGVPSRVAWDDIAGCDEGTTVIGELYGPVACLSPSGELEPFGESVGVPTYARELERLELPETELETLLRTIEGSQYLEASLVIFNDGEGSAQGVRISAPTGFRPDTTASVDDRCPRSGLDDEHDFSLPEQDHCNLILRGVGDGNGGLEDISSSLVFSASASNRTLLASVPLDTILVIVGVATVGYFVVYLFASFSARMTADDLK